MIAALVAVGCLSCASAQQSDVKKDYVKKDTYFSLMSYDGKKVSLDQFAGKNVLVIFVGSSCPDCQHASPIMERTYQKYGPKGLIVIGIAMDSYAEPVSEFAHNYGLTFPVLVNGEETARNYRCPGEPDFYLLDKNHDVYKYWIGDDGNTNFVADMNKTLDEVTK